MRLFLVISVIHWAFQVSAQRFNNSYPFSSNPDGITSVFQDSDSSFVTLGNTPTYPGRDIVLSRISRAGDTVWTTQYGNGVDEMFSGVAKSIKKVRTDRYVAAGSVLDTVGGTSGIVFMFNESGDTLFTKRYSEPLDHEFISSFVLHEDSILILGRKWNLLDYDVILYCIDSLGNSHWTKSYGSSSFSEYSFSIDADDNHIVIGGSRSTIGSSMSDIYVLKCDRQGNQMWEETLGESNHDYGSASLASDGSIFVYGSLLPDTSSFGYAYLAKLSVSKVLIWEKLYKFNPIERDGLLGVVETDNGDILGFGQLWNQEPSNYYEAFIVGLSDSGGLLWKRQHRGREGEHTYVFDWGRTMDQNYYMGGYVSPNGVLSQDSWLMVVDSLGCIETGCDITGLEDNFQSYDGIRIYPNPTSGLMSIEYNEFEQGRVEVHNMLGQVVVSKSLTNGVNELEITGNKGLYLISVFIGDSMISSEKIIKTH